jgi:hypothetical protein
MPHDARLVVFVHGWSVHNTDTYGEFPARLESEGRRFADLRLDVRQIWLSKYVSFRDEVRLEDISRAFQAALDRELGAELSRGRRFAAITHSTGGPVLRDWWHRHYRRDPQARPCPMSHLIMLAPANFGSALAQLGKGRVSRLKNWFEGVEPGTAVLDWLELGSHESWALNLNWIRMADPTEGEHPVFPFVLTGQSIDRKLYDHLNSYTDEAGSDGVVRAAAANLGAAYVRLEQEDEDGGRGDLRVVESLSSPRTAFALIPGRSHSGAEMGILRSVRNDGKPHPSLTAVLACLRVENRVDYVALCDRFDEQTASVRETERVEVTRHVVLRDTVYFHDAHSMVTFRLEDDRGFAVEDYDLLLTAGAKASPDLLPQGFFVDRQQNKRHRGTLTYYLNHDVMRGLPAVKDRKGRKVRSALPGTTHLGLVLTARPATGLVRYAAAILKARRELLEAILKPDQTTLVDISLKRLVHEGVFTLTRDQRRVDFVDTEPGPVIS